MAKADLKTVQDLENPSIKECPYCGCEDYYHHQFMSGSGVYYSRFDGDNTKVENGDIHGCLSYTPTGKFAYCNDCGKKVFRFKK